MRTIDRARQRAAVEGEPLRAPPQPLSDCNEHLVQSGLASPQAGFGDHEVYPELHVKAAVLGLAFARHQRCPDGNKRTAFILMFTFLAMNGYLLEAEQDDVTQTMLEAAVEQNDDKARTTLAQWVADHATKLELTP